jgi:YVTN family beta-propeller protein
VSPDGRHAYTTDYLSDRVSVIDTSTHTLVTAIPLRATTSPVALAVAPDGGTLYVATPGAGSVTVIDLPTHIVTAPLSSGTPRRLLVTPDGRHLFVVHGGGGIDIWYYSRSEPPAAAGRRALHPGQRQTPPRRLPPQPRDKKLRDAVIDFAADSRQASPWARDIDDRPRATPPSRWSRSWRHCGRRARACGP